MSLSTDRGRHTADDAAILTDREVKTVRDGCRESPRLAEHRGSDRRAFPVMQAMAPCDGQTLPHKRSLVAVRCRDLSTSGIALLLPDRPQFEFAVVALGKPPSEIHVLARVVHYRPVRDGLLVGCEFVRKVKLPA